MQNIQTAYLQYKNSFSHLVCSALRCRGLSIARQNTEEEVYTKIEPQCLRPLPANNSTVFCIGEPPRLVLRFLERFSFITIYNRRQNCQQCNHRHYDKNIFLSGNTPRQSLPPTGWHSFFQRDSFYNLHGYIVTPVYENNKKRS